MKTLVPVIVILFFSNSLFTQSLDPTFGDGGIVSLSLDGVKEDPRKIFLTPDGKILVCGQTRSIVDDNSTSDFLMVQFNEDGSLDTGFGIDGIKNESFVVNERDESRDVLFTEEGKMIVLIKIRDIASGRNSYGFTRLNLDGTTDLSFGDNGFIYYIDSENDYHLDNLQERNDGSYIATGRRNEVGFANMALIAHNQDGSLNTDYGDNGSVFQDFYFSFDNAQSSAIQDDDKVVCVGWSFNFNTTNTEMHVTRFNQNGSLDTDFATEGIYNLTAQDNNNRFSDVMIQADGKIFFAGQTEDGKDYNVIVGRLNSDGTFDENFNNGEPHILNYNFGNDRSEGIGILPNGDLIVAATVFNTATGNEDFALLRFDPDGTLNTDFGDNGWFLIDVDDDDECDGMVVQDDGKVILVGNLKDDIGTEADLLLVRVDPDGVSNTNDLNPGEVKVYPNPSQGRVSIEGNAIQRVELYNVHGEWLGVSSSSELDLRGLEDGLYYLRIVLNESELVRRLVLNSE